MCKLHYLLWGFLCVCLLTTGCKENDAKNTSFDPNLPIKFDEFLPDSGGIRTKFIIKGSNFGDDKNKVKVFFKDAEGNERQSLILGLTTEVIYTQVPKQSDGYSQIRVEIDGKEADILNPEHKFRYVVASSVSTVVGKAKEGGNTNGTIGETTFQGPQYVAIDNDDNLFVMDSDGSKARLVSLGQNKSITLFDGVFNQPTFLDKERKRLLCAGDNAGTGTFVFDADINWVPELYGNLLEAGAWMHSTVLDPIDSTFVIYRRNTKELYAQPLKKGLSYSKAKQIGIVGNGGSNGLCAYNPVDHYIYCVLHNYNAVYRFKLKRGEDGWPAMDGAVEEYIQNGVGFADGPLTEAKFSQPRGVAVDKDGYVYVADVGNHRIRKIDTKTGNVTTVAGTGVAGYVDGDPLDAQFNQPFGVAIDKDGFIYIADKGNHCIRKLAIE